MKILGFVGSMRKNRNTYQVVKSCLDAAEASDKNVETEIVYVADLKIEPCKACYELCSVKPYVCVVKDDLQKVLEKMVEADAIVLGCPRYFLIPSKMTAFMERLACLSFFTEMNHPEARHPLEDKPCGLIAVSGGADVMPVLKHLMNFALCLRMKVITLKAYPYFGVGGEGDVTKDEDLKPLENAKILGQKLVETIKTKNY